MLNFLFALCILLPQILVFKLWVGCLSFVVLIFLYVSNSWRYGFLEDRHSVFVTGLSGGGAPRSWVMQPCSSVASVSLENGRIDEVASSAIFQQLETTTTLEGPSSVMNVPRNFFTVKTFARWLRLFTGKRFHIHILLFLCLSWLLSPFCISF